MPPNELANDPDDGDAEEEDATNNTNGGEAGRFHGVPANLVHPRRAWCLTKREFVSDALRCRGFPNGLPTDINYPFDVVPEDSTPASTLNLAASLLGRPLNADVVRRLNALGQQDLRDALSIVNSLGLGFLECPSTLCDILGSDFSVQLPRGTPRGTPHVIVLQFEFEDNPGTANIDRTIFALLIRGGANAADLLLPTEGIKQDGRAYAYIFGPQARKYADEHEETKAMIRLQYYLWKYPQPTNGRNHRPRRRNRLVAAYCIFLRDSMRS